MQGGIVVGKGGEYGGVVGWCVIDVVYVLGEVVQFVCIDQYLDKGYVVIGKNEFGQVVIVGVFEVLVIDLDVRGLGDWQFGGVECDCFLGGIVCIKDWV